MALCCGCLAENELPDLLYDSEYFRLHADPEAAPCPGIMPWLEHHYRSIAPLLGIPEVPEEPIDIYVHDDVESLDEHGCKLDRIVDGCAIGTDVHVTNPYHPHELVHAYAFTLGRPPRFFQEGLAEVLGCRPVSEGDPIDREQSITDYFDSKTFVERGGNSADVYASAAGLTRFLLDRYGWDDYRRFYSNTSWDASQSTISEQFRAAFDAELDDTIELWRNGPAQTTLSVCMWPAECAQNPLLQRDEMLTCGPTVRGSIGNPAAAINSLTVPESSQVLIRSRTESEGLSLDLLGCEQPVVPTQAFPALSALNVEIMTELSPAKYWSFARIEGPEAEASAGTVTASLSSPVASLPCSETPVHDVDSEVELVVVRGAFPDGTDERQVSFRFRVAAPRELGIVRYGTLFDPDVPGRLSLCADACLDEPAACQSGPLADPLPFEGQWLEEGVTYGLVLEPETEGNLDYQIGISLNGS